MIAQDVIETAMYESIRRAAIQLPPDVQEALEDAMAGEPEPLARQHLQVSLDNARLASEGHGLVCGDTGFPLFFVTAGQRTEIEGGFGALQEIAARATARATADSFLRPTMVDPITRQNPGNNCGPGMPKLDLAFDGDDAGLRITAVPKGGGSEIFGTFYRMLFPSDGVEGVKRFVIDRVRDACYAGKICPPAIVGVGIGGTADLCVSMAKKAAVLRPVGQRHARADIAELEEELLQATRQLGVGPMGARGKCAVMALHIDVAVTHTAALPVAVNAQCLVGRRWHASITPSGDITFYG